MAGPEGDGAVIIMDRVVTCRLSWWVWDVAMRRGKSVSGGVKMGKFYGMELPRVGAFTEKWGS